VIEKLHSGDIIHMHDMCLSSRWTNIDITTGLSFSSMSFPLGKEQVKEMTSVFLPKKMRPCVKEMQIKTMLRFYLTPVRIATIKNTNNNKC
jgi:hypothetical protein